MDLRWFVVAFLVLSGCLAKTPQAPPAADAPESPDSAAEPAHEQPVDRQSRAGGREEEAPRPDPKAPFRWTGETNVAVCVEIPGGCVGFTSSRHPAQRVPVGPGPQTVRLTVTWTPTSSGFEELVLTAAQESVRGPSPLVLTLHGVRADFNAHVSVPHDTPLATDSEAQPFDGLAEYS